MRMSQIVKRCPNDDDDDDDDIRWIDFVVRNEIFVRPAATAAVAAAAVIERLRFGNCSTCTLLIHHHESV